MGKRNSKISIHTSVGDGFKYFGLGVLEVKLGEPYRIQGLVGVREHVVRRITIVRKILVMDVSMQPPTSTCVYYLPLLHDSLCTLKHGEYQTSSWQQSLVDGKDVLG